MSRTEDHRVLLKRTCNWSINWLTAEFTRSDPRMVLFTCIAKNGLTFLFKVPFIDGFITFTTILTNGYSMIIHKCSHLLFQNIMFFDEFIIETL